MIKDFVLSSDYPIDQVIYRSDTIPIAVGANDYKDDVKIPHTVGELFLPMAQFSTSSDFSQNVFEVTMSSFINGEFRYITNLEVDSNFIYISATNRTSAAVTFYFRVIGFALSNSHLKVPFTGFYHDMTFDTDNNQLKLYKSGSVTVRVNQPVQIAHGLEYRPLVLVWVEDIGRIKPLSYASLDLTPNSEYSAYVDKNALTLSYMEQFADVSVNYYYRIYADE